MEIYTFIQSHWIKNKKTHFFNEKHKQNSVTTEHQKKTHDFHVSTLLCVWLWSFFFFFFLLVPSISNFIRHNVNGDTHTIVLMPQHTMRETFKRNKTKKQRQATDVFHGYHLGVCIASVWRFPCGIYDMAYRFLNRKIQSEDGRPCQYSSWHKTALKNWNTPFFCVFSKFQFITNIYEEIFVRSSSSLFRI